MHRIGLKNKLRATLNVSFHDASDKSNVTGEYVVDSVGLYIIPSEVILIILPPSTVDQSGVAVVYDVVKYCEPLESG